MMDKKKLIEAANLLNDFCKNEMEGACYPKHCEYFDGEDCMIGRPCSWKIPKLRRWTDSDIALAKALKAFGVYKVGRVSNGGIRAYTVGATGGCGVPRGAFAALKQGEEASLNEILEEGGAR